MQEQEGWQASWHSCHSFFHVSNSPCSDPCFLNTSPWSTPVNQVNLVLVDVEDNPSAFLESGLSFDLDSRNSDYAFTSLDPTQGSHAWTFPSAEYGLGPVLTEDPATNDVLQTGDEVYGHSISSTFAPLPTSSAIDPNFQTSSLGQDVEANVQTTNPYAFPSGDIPPPDWGSTQTVTRSFVESPSTLNLANPAIGIYSPPYPGESSPEEALRSPVYTASSEQQPTPSKGPIYSCEWTDGNGTVCEEPITRETLPEHLSKHGIKNMTRDRRTKCNWVGCRRKNPINRESIVRHIREVHLRMKRSPKQVQVPYI